MLAGLPVELRSDFDLLASREKERDRDTCDSGHLNLVEYTHEFFHEPQRQVCILDAVYCQAPSSKFITILQFSNDTMMHVFFLLFEEVGRD